MSHKVARRLAFAPLLVLAVTGSTLWRCGTVYRLATLAQLSLHGAAALGLALRTRGARGRRLLRGPLLFDMAHVASLVAIVDIVRHRGRSRAVWIPQRPDVGPVDPVQARGDTAVVHG
jgi:hypothetical protein